MASFHRGLGPNRIVLLLFMVAMAGGCVLTDDIERAEEPQGEEASNRDPGPVEGACEPGQSQCVLTEPDALYECVEGMSGTGEWSRQSCPPGFACDPALRACHVASCAKQGLTECTGADPNEDEVAEGRRVCTGVNDELVWLPKHCAPGTPCKQGECVGEVTTCERDCADRKGQTRCWLGQEQRCEVKGECLQWVSTRRACVDKLPCQSARLKQNVAHGTCVQSSPQEDFDSCDGEMGCVWSVCDNGNWSAQCPAGAEGKCASITDSIAHPDCP